MDITTMRIVATLALLEAIQVILKVKHFLLPMSRF